MGVSRQGFLLRPDIPLMIDVISDFHGRHGDTNTVILTCPSAGPNGQKVAVKKGFPRHDGTEIQIFPDAWSKTGTLSLEQVASKSSKLDFSQLCKCHVYIFSDVYWLIISLVWLLFGKLTTIPAVMNPMCTETPMPPSGMVLLEWILCSLLE